MDILEYIQKIPYLLLFFLPLFLFFALGLWIAWWLWYKRHDGRLQLAYDRQRTLGQNLKANRSESHGLLKRLLHHSQEKQGRLLGLVSKKDTELKGIRSQFGDLETERDRLKVDLKAKDGDLRLRTQGLSEKDTEVNGLLSRISSFEGDIGSKDKELTTIRGDLKTKTARVGELEGQVKKLVGDTASREAQLKKLRDEADGKNAKFTDLEAKLKALQSDVEGRDARIAELESEIGSARGELDTKVSLLGNLEGQLSGLQKDLASKDESMGFLNLKLDEKVGEYDGLQKDLQGQVSGLKGDLEGRNARVAELEKALAELRGKLETKEGHANDLEGQLSGLKGDLEGRQAQLSDLEAERDLLREELKGTGARVTQLEQDLANKDSDFQGLQVDLAAKDDKLGLLHVQVEEAGAKDDEIHKLREANADLDSQLKARGDELGELQGKSKELQGDLEASESAISKLDAEIEALKSKLEDTSDLDEAKATVESKQAEIDALKSKLEDTSDLDEAMTMLEAKEAELDALKAKLEDTSEIDKAKSAVDSKQAEIDALKSKLDDTSELDALKNSIGALQGDLDAEREKAEAQTSGLSFFSGEEIDDDQSYGFLYAKRPSAIDDLKEIKGVAEKTEKELNDAGVYRHKQIALWSQPQLDAFAERLDFKGRVEREQWVNQAADLHFAQSGERLTPRVDIYHKPVVRTITKEVDPEALMEAFEGEAVSHDQKLGILYSSRPSKVDDLKEISGVANVLEGKLNDHGVYQYKQVALWTEDNVTEFSERLNFPDRIWRDQWVNQAVDLHFDAHGEHLTPHVPIYRKPEVKTRTVEVEKAEAKPAAPKSSPVQAGLFSGGDEDEDTNETSAGISTGSGSGSGSGRRVAFIMDVSRSLTDAQLRLSKAELSKAIEGLPAGARYQVVFFSGAVWFAHQRMTAGGERGQDVVIKDGNREMHWSSKFQGFEYEDGNDQLPSGEWLEASPESIQKTLKDIDDVTTSFGTTWHLPLTTAMNLEPAPKNIYFLTDGSTARQEEVADEMAELAKKCGGAKINTIALMVPEAAKPLNRLARKTGGRFSLVVAGGKVLDGPDLTSYLAEKDIVLD